MNTVPKTVSDLAPGDVIAIDPLHLHGDPVTWPVITAPAIIHAPGSKYDGRAVVNFMGDDSHPGDLFLPPDEIVMVQPPEVAERAARIAGGRALFDWLEATPDAPLPWDLGRAHIFIREDFGDDPARTAEVHRVADLMDVAVETSGSRHVAACLRFGEHTSYEVTATDVLNQAADATVPDPEPVPVSEVES